MEIIYVMEQGEYHHRRNRMVTTDVKLISQLYVDITKERATINNVFSLSMDYDKPSISIWVEGKYLTYFEENETNSDKMIKYLSKTAKGLK